MRVGKKVWNFQRQGGNGKFSEAREEFFRGGGTNFYGLGKGGLIKVTQKMILKVMVILK